MPWYNVRVEPVIRANQEANEIAKAKLNKTMGLILKHIHVLVCVAHTFQLCLAPLAARIADRKSREAIKELSRYRRQARQYRLKYYPTAPEETGNEQLERMKEFTVKLQTLIKMVNSKPALKRRASIQTLHQHASSMDLLKLALQEEQENIHPNTQTPITRRTNHVASPQVNNVLRHNTDSPTSPPQYGPVQAVSIRNLETLFTTETDDSSPQSAHSPLNEPSDNSFETVDLSSKENTPTKEDGTPDKDRSPNPQQPRQCFGAIWKGVNRLKNNLIPDSTSPIQKNPAQTFTV